MPIVVLFLFLFIFDHSPIFQLFEVFTVFILNNFFLLHLFSFIYIFFLLYIELFFIKLFYLFLEIQQIIFNSIKLKVYLFQYMFDKYDLFFESFMINQLIIHLNLILIHNLNLFFIIIIQKFHLVNYLHVYIMK